MSLNSVIKFTAKIALGQVYVLSVAWKFILIRRTPSERLFNKKQQGIKTLISDWSTSANKIFQRLHGLRKVNYVNLTTTCTMFSLLKHFGESSISSACDIVTGESLIFLIIFTLMSLSLAYRVLGEDLVMLPAHSKLKSVGNYFVCVKRFVQSANRYHLTSFLIQG